VLEFRRTGRIKPKQQKEIKIMNKPNIVRFTLVLAFLAASTSLTWSQDRQSRQLPNPMNTIVGVWEVTRHGVDCNTGQEISSFPALMTFHRDGTLSGQAYSPVSTNAYGPAEHGVWQHEPGDTFSARFVSYSYDDSGAFASSIVVTATGQLTRANSFSYNATIQIYDADGNPLPFTLCGRSTATRFE
jgi:hypothetical protein